MPKPKKLKLVFIEWMDHNASVDRWSKFSTLEDRANPLLIVSVGWILKQTKEALVLVPHRYSDKMEDWIPHGSGDMTILRCAVKKMVVLKEPRI